MGLSTGIFVCVDARTHTRLFFFPYTSQRSWRFNSSPPHPPTDHFYAVEAVNISSPQRASCRRLPQGVTSSRPPLRPKAADGKQLLPAVFLCVCVCVCAAPRTKLSLCEKQQLQAGPSRVRHRSASSFPFTPLGALVWQSAGAAAHARAGHCNAKNILLNQSFNLVVLSLQKKKKKEKERQTLIKAYMSAVIWFLIQESSLKY